MRNRSFALLISTLIITLFAIFYAYPSSAPQTSITMSLSSKLSITDVNLKGEKVLIRVDFNVP